MESVLLVIHVIVAVAIVALIMLQQGKGAEMGASFGSGSSQTVFGAAGSGNFFSRLTSILVAVFFATSLVLAILSKERVTGQDDGIPDLETVPAAQELNLDDIPAADEAALDEDVVDDQDIPVAEDANEGVPAAIEGGEESESQP